MHPAYSVIFFTTASGAGYGLLVWLGLAALAGVVPTDGWLAVIAMTLALGLATAGLVASTLHLGRPKRTLRAYTQWRSSWLSREGVAATATYAPAGLLWLAWLIGADGEWTAVLALLSILGAVVTVWCTGMIYASLPTIRQWHRGDVPMIYMANAAATGLILLLALVALAGGGISGWAALLALLVLAVAAALKWRYWKAIDGDPGQYTAEMALGHIGTPRTLDPPHTQPNFVMREMGYRVARKHAERLRLLVLLSLFAVPALLVAGGALLGGLAWLPLLLAVASAAAGVLAERWLYFAEAEHVAMLYYGRARA